MKEAPVKSIPGIPMLLVLLVALPMLAYGAFNGVATA